MKADPMLVYQAQVGQTLESNLPLPNKVIGNKLVLHDYTLDSGQLNAFSAAIRITRKPAVE